MIDETSFLFALPHPRGEGKEKLRILCISSQKSKDSIPHLHMDCKEKRTLLQKIQN
jgi:hypothetical protein